MPAFGRLGVSNPHNHGAEYSFIFLCLPAFWEFLTTDCERLLSPIPILIKSEPKQFKLFSFF